MDITFLAQFATPVIVGICLCLGYIIKTSIPKIDNKYIPLIMGIVGLLLSVWINMGISPEIVLAGLFSGLSSTGLYEMFKNLINKE